MYLNKFIVFLISFAVCHIEDINAFECGFKKQPSQNLRNVLTQCLNGEQTLDKILEMTNNNNSTEKTENQQDDSSAENDDEEEPQIVKGSNSKIQAGSNRNSNDWNTKFNKMRSRRAARSGLNREELMKVTSKTYPNIKATTERPSTTLPSANEENDDSSVDSEDNSDAAQDGDGSENNMMCAVQCVFDKLEMTDSNGLPDQAKFLDGLLQSATSRDLKNFLRKSTNECFQQMEQEDSQDPCKYSAKIVACLAEKGRQDCSDWPSSTPLPL